MPWASAAGEPSSVVAVMPSGSSTAWCRYVALGHARSFGQVTAQRLEPGVGVDAAGARPSQRLVGVEAEPLAWPSRCRTVEPGGPAGSSRLIVASSTAISTA